jgi:hypothetical protein
MNETLRYGVHALHDIAGATWFGGNLFGVAALNSGVRAAHNPHERGAVLNKTWENFAPYSVASALAFGGTWAAIRLTDPRLSDDPLRTVARVRDWLTVGAVAGTVASGALNRVIASERRVPVESGTAPIEGAENEAENTPPHIARAQRAMRFVAAADLLVGAGLIATGAVLEQQLMDYSPAKGLLTGPRKLALDAVKAVAAAELVRRAGKLLGDSVEALRPHAPATAARIKAGALRQQGRRGGRRGPEPLEALEQQGRRGDRRGPEPLEAPRGRPWPLGPPTSADTANTAGGADIAGPCLAVSSAPSALSTNPASAAPH